MVFTLSIYINCSKIEEANEALKKSLHQVENIICCYQKTSDIVAEKQKLQTCLTSLKDGLVEC
jgi:hypothetical protein